jgi:hypothetical protein
VVPAALVPAAAPVVPAVPVPAVVSPVVPATQTAGLPTLRRAVAVSAITAAPASRIVTNEELIRRFPGRVAADIAQRTEQAAQTLSIMTGIYEESARNAASFNHDL